MMHCLAWVSSITLLFILFVTSNLPTTTTAFVATTTPSFTQYHKSEPLLIPYAKRNAAIIKPLIYRSSPLCLSLPARYQQQPYPDNTKRKIANTKYLSSPSPFKETQLYATEIENNDNDNDNNFIKTSENKKWKPMQILTRLTPLWTLLAAFVGLTSSPSLTTPLSSLKVTKTCLTILMLSMGIAVTPPEMSKAITSPKLIFINAILCFGMMPFLALGIAKFLLPGGSGGDIQTGLILLGSVSGGQASNLFALLAGGDAALSVAFTLFTTLVGAVATPTIIRFLLDSSSGSVLGGIGVAVDAMGVLRSVISLALVPLLLGLSTSKVAPKLVETKLRPLCPFVGIIATLFLVAGGAAGSSTLLLSEPHTLGYSILAATLLPLLGGLISLVISKFVLRLKDRTTRTLVVETLSKSPTLAYVLARRHFSAGAAIVPAAAMVTLAVVGAAVASVWSMVPIVETTTEKVVAPDTD